MSGSPDNTSFDVEAVQRAAQEISQVMADMSAFDELAGHDVNTGQFETAYWLGQLLQGRKQGLVRHVHDLKAALEEISTSLQTTVQNLGGRDDQNAADVRRSATSDGQALTRNLPQDTPGLGYSTSDVSSGGVVPAVFSNSPAAFSNSPAAFGNSPAAFGNPMPVSPGADAMVPGSPWTGLFGNGIVSASGGATALNGSPISLSQGEPARLVPGESVPLIPGESIPLVQGEPARPLEGEAMPLSSGDPSAAIPDQGRIVLTGAPTESNGASDTESAKTLDAERGQTLPTSQAQSQSGVTREQPGEQPTTPVESDPAGQARPEIKTVSEPTAESIAAEQPVREHAVAATAYTEHAGQTAAATAQASVAAPATWSTQEAIAEMGFAPVPTGDVGDWIHQAIQVLQANGVPLSDADIQRIATIIQHESGGNPSAINLWDANAQAGHPSMGLMQCIDTTFEAYKLPGHNEIANPVDNIIAGVRYAIARYGSLTDVPGLQSLAHGGNYVGY